jgi:hypothetical protein
MNSSGVTVLGPFEDRCDPLETSDLVDGDLGMGFVLDVLLSVTSSCAFCFLVGESLLPNVKVLLRGRSRLVELAELVISSGSLSSAEPS